MKQLFIYLLAVNAVLTDACVSRVRTPLQVAGIDHAIDSFAGSCPYLTSDAQGRPVLSWVRERSDSSAVFCYAVSEDSGHSFSAPVEIPASSNVFPHAENLPKLVFKPDGEIIAVWGAAHPNPDNKYAGLVYYSQSFDTGKTWSAATPLVKDTSAKDQRYFDLQVLPTGEAVIAWLDARKTTHQKGSALYLAITRGGAGFQLGHLVEQPCCECCRINLAVHGNRIHLVYRAIISDSIRDMVHAVSSDGGNQFSAPRRISADNWVVNSCPHSGPSMVTGGGQVQVAWFTGGEQTGIFYSRLPADADRFTTKDAVSSTGRHPQIAQLADGEAVIAWEEPVQLGNKMYSRIGLEARGRQGTIRYRHFVTPDTVQASYPVLRPLPDGDVLVAYTMREERRSRVRFQRVSITSMGGYWQQHAAGGCRAAITKRRALVAIANTTDPFCGMSLDKQASDTLLWKERVLGFCSPECKLLFQHQRHVAF